MMLSLANAEAQQQCAPCHPKEVAAHQSTGHARAARPVRESEFFRNLPQVPIGEARSGFLLSYAPVGEGLQVTAERKGERASALIQWVFGAGHQGETPVATRGSQLLEHRISYYTAPRKFDLTLGHRPGPSTSATAAVGVFQDAATMRACLGCHTTVGDQGQVLRLGVECARCHIGAAKHAEGQGKPSNPAKLEARAEVTMCAECHRLEAIGKADDPLNIRFQPLRLVQSACFTSGRVKCTHCHEAHQDARHDSAYYVSKCVACHASPHRTDDCLPCHMPRSSPAPYLSFTDHYIRKESGAPALKK